MNRARAAPLADIVKPRSTTIETARGCALRMFGFAAAISPSNTDNSMAMIANGGREKAERTLWFAAGPRQRGKNGTFSLLRLPRHSQTVTANHGSRPINHSGAAKTMLHEVYHNSTFRGQRLKVPFTFHSLARSFLPTAVTPYDSYQNRRHPRTRLF